MRLELIVASLANEKKQKAHTSTSSVFFGTFSTSNMVTLTIFKNFQFTSLEDLQKLKSKYLRDLLQSAEEF